MKKFFFVTILFFMLFKSNAQSFLQETKASKKWVDSVFKTLTIEEKIAQTMILRAHSNLGDTHVQKLMDDIQKYKVGGLCFFQGGPARQAILTNKYNSISKLPLMISIDAEWGLGMRLDSVISLPKPMMLGATMNEKLAYEYGKVIADQCNRLGIHVNYAPVADVNNNPDNPVINDRSFGEDRSNVALLSSQVMKGMQDNNVIACGKHFPGHGDVTVDSHFDLPIILKSIDELDSTELYPFKKLIKEKVGMIMNAHLFIPSIDSTKNTATSLSYNSSTKLLKNRLNYKGLTITDGMEMKGISKFYTPAQANTQAIIAGNHLLCLPAELPETIDSIKVALTAKRINKKDFNKRIKQILNAKYWLCNYKNIELKNITEDINSNVSKLNNEIASAAITTIAKQNEYKFPAKSNTKETLYYIAIGTDADNEIIKSLGKDFILKPIFINGKLDSMQVNELYRNLNKYPNNGIVIGMHNIDRKSSNNFGIHPKNLYALQLLSTIPNAMTIMFGNAYSAKYITKASNAMIAYNDESYTQQAVAAIISGKNKSIGTLPVTVCKEYKMGISIQ